MVRMNKMLTSFQPSVVHIVVLLAVDAGFQLLQRWAFPDRTYEPLHCSRCDW
jgi:hypothetical protein